MSTFVAIDFETATTRRDSACAVGLAAGCNGRVVLARTYLVRPPTAQFTFTDLHGLDWEDVHDAPTFAELWPTLRAWIDDAAFVAAHNAPFDRSVLHACPQWTGQIRPFVDTANPAISGAPRRELISTSGRRSSARLSGPWCASFAVRT